MSIQICPHCKKSFEYPNKEYNRRIKKGIFEFFCSISCSTTYRNLKNPKICVDNLQKAQEINKNNNFKFQCRPKGKFTQVLNKCRARAKKKNYEYNLDEEYLKSIWSGICAISKIPITNDSYNNFKLNSASLDRINSNKGYIKGNVQFVAYGINLAKNNFTDEEVLEFLNHIKSH